MTELREVTRLKPDVNTDLIALLEKVLTQARNGELESIAVAGVRTDGWTCSGWSCPTRPVLLLGEIEVMKGSFLQSSIETEGADHE